ncbi:efflux RND transporter periplasmic adaptor subunit [Breznakiella homolactica]|uniref:Efflux RND transporter periplasmic adaptor subunit n=1 Tax=Breznakiella homolactica TaxID=2798577 RepID=A0A7T7XP09_9SPIR|nr:efflux RND transporter periplasmic adaptor subunit [Breznakiella homolactica]QQO09757.1 efflux RND transporter periplasmic adaptor subunit [Breznakiella homolactica]
MKKMKPNGLALSAFAVVILLVLSGCGENAQAGGDKSGEEAVPVFAVNTTTAVQGQISDYLMLSGDIVAGSTVDVFSDAAGKITALRVAVGDRVWKDTPIAVVDPSRPGMKYVPGVAKSPIAGTIVSLPAQVGMTITQATPIARVSGGGALEIKLFVAERFISKMALGLPAVITLDAYPGESFRGSISEISPVVDPASRTMEVRVNVENPGSKLKAGMFTKVRIITEQKDNIVKIPSTAMVQRFGENYVFTVEPDPSDPAFKIVRRKVVTPGILIDGVLEVQQGLNAEDEIVVRGQSLLEDGVRVNVVEHTAPLSATN